MLSGIKRKLVMASSVGVVAAGGLTAAVTANAHTTHAQHTHAAHTRPAASGKTVTVTLHNYMFNPSSITIKPGTTVVWKWEDAPSGMHNITPLKKKGGLSFKGTGIHTRGTYSVKFTKAGTYYYECSVHPLTMQAKIIVKK